MKTGKTEKQPEAVRSSSGKVAIVLLAVRSAIREVEVGARPFLKHPTTDVLTGVILFPDDTVGELAPGQLPSALREHIAAAKPLAVFGQKNLLREYLRSCGQTDRTEIIDLVDIARLYNQPDKLAELSEIAFGVKSTDRLSKAMGPLSRPDIRTGKLPPVARAKVDEIKNILEEEAVTIREIGRWFGRRVVSERDIRAVDDRINARGFGFDVELARAALAMCQSLTREAETKSGISAASLRSNKQFQRALMKEGLDLGDLKKATLNGAAQYGSKRSKDLIRARLLLMMKTEDKLKKGLTAARLEGRIYDVFVYCGATTGRWTGRGVQPQNLPRGISLSAGGKALIIKAIKSGDTVGLASIAKKLGEPTEAILATMVRSCIIPSAGKRFAILDYSSIEARVSVWAAGDQQGIDNFRQGQDPYCLMAGLVYRIEPQEVSKEQRRLGKALVLGCGYGMGHKRFKEYAEVFDVNWDQSPITPKKAVELWRNGNTKIAGGKEYENESRWDGLWQKLESAAKTACTEGKSSQVGPFWFRKSGNDVIVTLPSGRDLVYGNMRLEVDPTDKYKRKVLFYSSHGGPRKTFGGKLTENLVQAVSRDLLAHALVKLEAAGFETVMHVHDEVVCEISDESSLQSLKEIMTDAPAWASGLPLAVTSIIADRYQK